MQQKRKDMVAELQPKIALLALRLLEIKGANSDSDDRLLNADFTRANLQGMNLSGANLANANFTHANLAGAILSRARLNGATFTNANMVDVDLEGAFLQYARLNGSNLQGARLEGVKYHEQTVLPDAEYKAEPAKVNTKTMGTLTSTRHYYTKYWRPNTDMTRYTNPNHPDFWRSHDEQSPAYNKKTASD